MIPYRAPSDTGFWGIPTSTIDWCEENYVVTHYIAEAVNTATNAAFILLAHYAWRNARKFKLEQRFVYSCYGFMLVGIGSWLFHMTLQYRFQLLDELPMIYATCIPLWSTFTWDTSKKFERSAAIAVVSGASFLTAVYLRYKNPTIHQAAYGAMNVIIILKSTQQARRYVTDRRALANLNRTLYLGASEFLFGWFLWNLDIHLCDMWRSWRRAVGIPLGFLLEGHGWWHLFTGLAVYSYLVYLQYLRAFLLKKADEFEYVWKFGIIPVMQPNPLSHKNQ